MAPTAANPLSRRTLLAAAALAAALPGAARADRESTAAALVFLQAIYAAYKHGGPGVRIGDRTALERYFTTELAGLIADDDARAATAGEVPNLDADPFIDAQDGVIGDITVTVSEAPDGRMTGQASFTNSGDPKRIELMLVQTTTGWRIDDIRWPEGTLRGLYSH